MSRKFSKKNQRKNRNRSVSGRRYNNLYFKITVRPKLQVNQSKHKKESKNDDRKQ